MAEVFSDLDIANETSDRLAYFTKSALLNYTSVESNVDELPRLHFEMLPPSEEKKLKEIVVDVVSKLKKGEAFGENSLAELTFDKFPELDNEITAEAIEKIKRNQFGDSGSIPGHHDPHASTHIAAGVIAIAGAAVINSIVSKKFDSGAFDPDGPSLGPDDGPIWPKNPNTPGVPDTPWRPGQPGWTDPVRPGVEKQLSTIIEPRIRSVFVGASSTADI